MGNKHTTVSRHSTKVVRIGTVAIGGKHPVAIQSMTKARTQDADAALRQIRALADAGCEIVRCTVDDMAAAVAIKKIKARSALPVVADIHFDWRLAVAAIEAGVDKIRLNPGNIYKPQEVREVARCAKAAGIPIRVGVNSGSVRKTDTTASLARAMVKSALDYIRLLEHSGFYNIVVSLKGSGIFDTIEAYRRISTRCEYPLHLGLTATGVPALGAVKSSIALGMLLSEGIGDTIRVSLTDDPVQEVYAAQRVLEALGLRNFGPEIISCPTCGRCRVDLGKIVRELEQRFSGACLNPRAKSVKVAVMGCVVNGPGEAKEADIGVAFGSSGEGLLFKKGKPQYKVTAANCIKVLLKELH